MQFVRHLDKARGMRWDELMEQGIKRRFSTLSRVCGFLLLVFLVAGGMVFWRAYQDVRAGQRRLAEVARMEDAERNALFQGCLGMANRELGPVESEHWPAVVAALKPERVHVRDNGVVVELNAKSLRYAALLLSRKGEGDSWKLFLVNFDGANEFWPSDQVE